MIRNPIEEFRAGALKVRVDGDPARRAAGLVVVLCHGYGAPGDDLVPLAREMRRYAPALGDATFVFPEAPLDLGMWTGWPSRAWWAIDPTRYERALASGNLRSLTREEPEGLAKARALLDETIGRLRAQWGFGSDQLVVGGFSQGAMLATDWTLRAEAAPAGLVVWSGALIAEASWRALAPARKGLRVLQSHGRQDPLLPFEVATWLRDLLVEAGLAVDFVPFDGPHTIPRHVVALSASWVAARAAGG